jgi:hypothetical protein
MNEQQLVFDRARPLNINLRRWGKKAKASFPSDDQNITLNAGMKIYSEKGKSTLIVEGETEAAAKLFDEIKIEGDDFDQDQKALAISHILSAEIEEPERVPEGYRVPVVVCGGIRTVHILNDPTVNQEKTFDTKCLFSGERRFNRVQLRYSLPALAALYEDLYVGAEGYPGSGKEQLAGIPVRHRQAALKGLFDFVKSADLEAEPISF